MSAISSELRRIAKEIDTPEHCRQAAELLHLARRLDTFGSALNDAATEDVVSRFFTLDTVVQCQALGTLCGAARATSIAIAGQPEAVAL